MVNNVKEDSKVSLITIKNGNKVLPLDINSGKILSDTELILALNYKLDKVISLLEGEQNDRL